MSERKTYRFWTWQDGGWVKLALKDGQGLRWHRSWLTDEGFSYKGEEYYRQGNVVTCEHACGGRDCDGRLDQFYEYCVDINDPMEEKDPGIWVPKWEEVNSRQYDQYAEMMGY